MDKYEFNMKVEQIKKLVMKEDYTTAMKMADTIDWHRVRNTNLLSMISRVYEKNGEYQEAREILLQAYERAPVGKLQLFKLSELALRVGSLREAEDYYREFCEVAPGDSRQSLLRYMILKARGVSVEKLIPVLEKYVATDMDERWMYELAELYSRAGDKEKCVQLCDKMILMFGLGNYVEKAMELKLQYAPLNDYQQDLVENKEKYEAKLKAVEEEFARGPLDMLEDDEFDEDHYPEERYSEEEYPEYPGEEEYREEGEYPGEGEYREEGEYPGEGTYREEGGNPGEGAYQEARSGAVPVSDKITPEEELVASLREAAVEENLAHEVSRIARESKAGAVSDEPTKPLYDIRRSGSAESASADGARAGGSGTSRADGNGTSRAGIARDFDDGAAGAGKEAADRSETGARSAAGAEAAGRTETGTRAETADVSEDTTGKGADAKDADAEEPRVVQEAVSAHLSIEARSPEKGLKAAVEALKRYHLAMGTHNQTLKITGSRLSSRGVRNVSEKLRGWDLIIEEAGDLLEEELEDLAELMADDDSGMVVVLIDNPRQMEELYQKNPEFMQMFEHIDGERAGEDSIEQAVMRQVAEEERLAQREEGAREKGARGEGSGEEGEIGESARKEGSEEEGAGKEKAGGEGAIEEGAAEGEAEEGTIEESAIEEAIEEGAGEETIEEGAEEADSSFDGQQEEDEGEYGAEEADEYEEEMDADQFAEYACQYASRIDCSILGKSMLALYERVELMEENGIPLTRANAEELIEEAADKAEKPSLGRMITGIFLHKYNKEGLLILREEHFI